MRFEMARPSLLCVQLQPARAKSIDLEAVASLLASRAMAAGIRELFIERGRGNSWINFTYRSASVAQAWRSVQKALQHRRWGTALRGSTIVTCEGSRGWDDYKLLHHFDPSQALDRLPASSRKSAPPN